MVLDHNNSMTLGIYGDGQLARLIALEARSKGLSVVAFSLNSEDSPCRGIVDRFIEGKSWDDEASFLSFLKGVNIIALENEFIPPEFLFKAEQRGLTCFPSAKSYEALSNKFKQVHLAHRFGIKTPKTILLNGPDSLNESSAPLMLKALRGGYDGYGNFLFNDPAQLAIAKNFIRKAGPTLGQEIIDFEKEVAVMVARGKNGAARLFPVVETIQENNICHYTLIPARVDEALTLEIQKAASDLIEGFNGVGLFGVEFFLRGREVIFNEVAPRPHNSAHLTIEACNISQFGALVELALNRPVPIPQLTIPSAGMLNLLGTRNGPAHFDGKGFTAGHLHLYGKKDSRPGRKMGHYTLTGEDTESVLIILKELKSRYEL